MDKLGSQAYHYLNASKGPNYEGIDKYIYLLPKINSEPYYKFQNFYFPDFKMTIYKKKQSVKEYYINKFYEVLISHFSMLVNLDKDKDRLNDLMFSSILKDRAYYKYCKHRDLLENIYKKQ
jgi:hypothetical protein